MNPVFSDGFFANLFSGITKKRTINDKKFFVYKKYRSSRDAFQDRRLLIQWMRGQNKSYSRRDKFLPFVFKEGSHGFVLYVPDWWEGVPNV